MISSLSILQEAIKVSEVNMKPGEKKASIYMGRFQPLTLAHAQIIESMKQEFPDATPFIFIVKGKSSSEDKEKNPLPFNVQKDIIIKSVGSVVPSENIIEASDAFIGTFVDACRNKNYEPVALFCGSDRLSGYKAQVEQYKDRLNFNIEVIETKRTSEDISATKLRQSIKDDDLATFLDMTKNLGEKEFAELKKYIKDESINEEVQYINLSPKPNKTTIAQVDSKDKKFVSIIDMIKKQAGISTINDDIENVYLNNPKKKSKKTKAAAEFAMHDITDNLKLDGSIQLTKVSEALDKPFILKDAEYSIEDIISNVRPFFNDKFYTTIFKRTFGAAGGAQMGPGEYALWVLFNNVDFNDQKGDLIIDGNKVEVKGHKATVGTNAAPFKSFSMVKKILLKIATDIKYADIEFLNAAGLGLKNAVGLVKMLAAINKLTTKNEIMSELALAFINTTDTSLNTLGLEFKKVLLTINDKTEPSVFCQQLVAYHLKNYQKHDDFSNILIYKDANLSMPTGCVILNPSHFSIVALGKQLTTYKIRFNGWDGGRLGGCSILNVKTIK